MEKEQGASVQLPVTVKIDASSVIEQLEKTGGFGSVRKEVINRLGYNEAGNRITSKTEQHVNNRNLLQSIETTLLEEGKGIPTFRKIHAQLSKKLKASETIKQVVGEELNMVLNSPMRNGRTTGKEYITRLIEESILQMLVPNYVPESRIPPPERIKKLIPPMDPHMYPMDLMRPNIGHKRKYEPSMIPPPKHYKTHYYHPLH